MNRKERVKDFIIKNNENGKVPYIDVIHIKLSINRNYVMKILDDLFLEGFLDRGPNRSYRISEKYVSPEKLQKMKSLINKAFNICHAA